MQWASAATIVAALTAVIGLQSFWIARALDELRGEMHRGLDRLEVRLDRIDGREPPSLRRL